MSEKLAGSAEDNILTLITWDDTNAMRLRMELPADLFSTRTYRLIVETAYSHIDKFGVAPKAHIRDLLEDNLRGKEGEALTRILDAIDELAPNLQPEFVLSQLDQFVRSRQIGMALAEAADALHQGDLDRASALMMSSPSIRKVQRGLWLSDPEAMLRFLDRREEDGFSSGIAALDARGIVPARKTFFLFIGTKGIGKSWWHVQMGKANIMRRRSVLHISLENSEELTAQRYIQALFAMSDKSETLRIPYFKRDSAGRFLSIEDAVVTPPVLNRDARNELTKKLENFKRRPRLMITEFPTGALTVPELAAYLDYLERAENFRPDLLILDQPFNMQFNANDMRGSRGKTMVDLRGLAVKRDMALVGSWQGNRLTDTAKVVTSGHAAEDWSITGTADIICTISRTAAEFDSNLARILVDKARTARDKMMFLITQSYATGQFALDSIYMSKFVQDEAARISGVEQGEE